MKSFSISRLPLTLAAILMAISAHANFNLQLKDIHLLDVEYGTEITIPIAAEFDTPIDIWELNITLPEGLVPVGVINGWGMFFYYDDSSGEYREYTAQIATNEDFTHIIGYTGAALGYQRTVNDEGEIVYEPYGALKWEDRYYYDLILLKIFVDPNFTGGDIQISGNATCGYDTRYDTSNFIPDPAIDGSADQADINGDCVIDISDVTRLINYLIGSHEGIHGGDINQDGNIDILDYDELMDFLLFEEWHTGHQLYSCQTSAAVSMTITPVNEPAEVSFYIDDLELTPDDLGTRITIPVHAHFSNYISSWDVQFIFPEGLTPFFATRGSDMTMTFMTGNDEECEEMTENNYLCSNDTYTRFIATPIPYVGYGPSAVEDDLYEPYGTVKWAAGDYDEMFLIKCNVSESFTGGDIKIITNASSGYDTRNDLMDFIPIPIESHHGFYWPGDLNNDGEVNISDITEGISCLLNQSAPEYFGDGDLNYDGSMNIVDIDALYDYLIHGQMYAGYVLSQGESEATFTVNFPDYTGDVNGDGEINVSDITLLIDMLLTQEYIDYNELMDVNGDSEINVSDVTALIDKLINQN